MFCFCDSCKINFAGCRQVALMKLASRIAQGNLNWGQFSFANGAHDE